jgi:N-acetyl-alpha-D-muramate 1-phosphate uridylyltransferase
MTQPAAPIAILAGGLATRLRPLTETIPKSLLDVQGEAFIGRQLELLKASGLHRVVICAGHLGEMIRDHVGDGARYGLEVAYSFDGCQLLGTAGALRNARHLLGDRFQVIYGDSYLTCDYLAIQAAMAQSGRKALMTVYRNEGQYDTSNIEYADGEILAYSKTHRTDRMHHIDYGLGVIDAAVLDAVPDDRPCDLANLYAELLAQRQLAAYEVPGRFYEIGSVQGLDEMRDYFSAPHRLSKPSEPRP